MTTAAHLWAIGYDDMGRADQVREIISGLGWDPGQAAKDLILVDIAVVVRRPDGSFKLDRQPFPAVANILACTAVGFLAGLVVSAPLPRAAGGAPVGGGGTAGSGPTGGGGPRFLRRLGG